MHSASCRHDVPSEVDGSLLEVAGHVRVPRSMIHDDPLDQHAVRRRLVLHLHNLHLFKRRTQKVGRQHRIKPNENLLCSSFK